MTMSDRIAVMNKGRYEQLGEPEVLYERPLTRFVAGFLGVSNLLPGAVEDNDGTYAAVRLADDRNLTLAGFARGGRVNVYTGAQRVI